jgi:hypothetical protein
MEWVWERYGIQKYFDRCLATACLAQGENNVLESLGVYYQRMGREVSVFRTIGSMKTPVGCLIKAEYQ